MKDYIIAGALLLLMTPPAWADSSPDPFLDLVTMDQGELAEHRAGMIVGGIPMDFAIVVRTTAEQAVAQGLENAGLQTVLTINHHGGIGSVVTTPLGNLGDGTSFLHDVSGGQIATVIANTVSGVSINQNTEINAAFPGLQGRVQAWQGTARAGMLGGEAAQRGLR